MLETNRYSVINIRRYLNSDNPKLGESRLLQVLSGFSCPRNPDVERFLKKSSVEFTKKNQSVKRFGESIRKWLEKAESRAFG